MKSWYTGGNSKKIELLTCQVQVSRNWGWCQNGNRWTLSLWKHLNLPHAWKGMYHTARQRPTLSFSPSLSLHPATNLVKHPSMAIHQHDSLKEREQRLAPHSHRETRNSPWTAYALQAKSVLIKTDHIFHSYHPQKLHLLWNPNCFLFLSRQPDQREGQIGLQGYSYLQIEITWKTELGWSPSQTYKLPKHNEDCKHQRKWNRQWQEANSLGG